MAAVSDPPIDSIVSAPTREVMYASRRDELVLVHTAEYPILNAATGQKSGRMTEGVRVQFTNGMLRVPLEGNVTTAQGRKFPAPELIEWLDNHPRNGDQDDGFFKIAQVAPPASDAEIERITEAATLHDLETLQSILDAERSGWKRPTIVNTVVKRIEQISQIRAEYEASIAAQVEAEDAKPAAKRQPKG